MFESFPIGGFDSLPYSLPIPPFSIPLITEDLHCVVPRWAEASYPAIPMSNKTWTLNPREDMLPLDQMVCTGTWWGMCQKTG
jgi:hypothetical protein